MDWKGVGRTPRHGSPIHSRSRLAQTRRATMLDGSMIPGNSLVFGPGGQASIIAPQDNGDGPQMASQGSDQFPQGVPDIGTDSTIAANTMSPSNLPSSSIQLSSDIPTSTSTAASSTLSPVISVTSSPSVQSAVSTSTSSQPTTSSLTSTISVTTSVIPSSSAVSEASSGSAHDARFYAGVAFGIIAALTASIAFLTWWLRIRRRSRRRSVSGKTLWPWTKDTIGGYGSEKPSSLTDGASYMWEPRQIKSAYGGHGAGLPQTGETDIGGTYPRLPPVIHLGDGIGSYPTVQLCSANSSVPDLAPDMGTLQVTNLMPDDLRSESSGGASRASSALGIASMSHALSYECGTPYAPMAIERPRFLGLHGSGLTVPWALKERPASMGRLGTSGGFSDKDRGPLPYPGDGIARGTQTSGWAASLKWNLVNAFNAVVGANNANEPTCSTWTPAPTRIRGDCRSIYRDAANSGLGTLSRASTMRSVHSSFKEWKAENNGQVTSPFHVHLPERADSSPWLSGTLLQEYIQEPSRAEALPECQETSPSLPESRMDVKDEDGFHEANPAGITVMDLPQLPELPSYQAEQHRRMTTQTRRRVTKRPRGSRRPTMPSGRTSSYCSDISRQSSVSSERLTDAEQFAKKMLRERRKRVLEMSTGPRRRTSTQVQEKFVEIPLL